MYYIGIYYDISPQVPSACAVMEKNLKNLRRHYRLIDLAAFPSPCDDTLIHEKIKALHQDRSFFMVKKVFSQDRKPTKKVPTHPSVVCGFKNETPSPLVPVRKAGIPVDCLVFNEDNARSRDKKPDFTPGQATHTSISAVVKTMSTVIRQNRLDGESLDPWGELRDSLLTMNDGTIDPSHHHLIMAMAIPVWLAENVRKIYRY